MSVLSIPSFTNVGYRVHSKRFDPIDTDLNGKTVLITGGTGGIGLAAASELSRLGARLLLVGRSESRLDAAARSIDGEVVALRADLSLLAEVERVANWFLAREKNLDVLVNNVGVLYPERTVTTEGIEATLATNLAGHFLLTNRLARLLADTRASRIINVTSGGMYSERIRPDSLGFDDKEYLGTAAYSRTKRGQVILTEMWSERFSTKDVMVNAMHPGWVRTAGVARSLPTFNRAMGPLLRTPAQGADTIVWLAGDDGRPSHTSGELWFDRAVVPTHLIASTMESAQDREGLWSALVALTGSDLVERSGIEN